MLSKQVKARRTLNFNRRQINAVKEMRPRLKASLNNPLTQNFLSSRRLKNILRLIRLTSNTPALQAQLSSKHIVSGGQVTMGGKRFYVSPTLKGSN